jgi:hypothetical protein
MQGLAKSQLTNLKPVANYAMNLIMVFLSTGRASGKNISFLFGILDPQFAIALIMAN